ncbi:hypothetical protein Tco_1517855 [Tanacetum coccineum]
MAKLRFKMFKEDSLKVIQTMLERVKLHEQGLSIQLEMQEQINQGLEENDDCNDLQLHTIVNFKAGHVEAYDLNCDDQATSSAIFKASLSPTGSLNDETVGPTYDSNTLSEMKYNDHFVSHDDSYELTSDMNVISYAEYMVTIEDKAAHYVASPVQDKNMKLSVIEKNEIQVDKCTTVIQEAKSVNESLTTELEKYKARVKTLEQEYNSKKFLTKREAFLDSELQQVIVDQNRKMDAFENQVFA